MKTPRGIWVEAGECTEITEARNLPSWIWTLPTQQIGGVIHGSLKVLYLLQIMPRFYYVFLFFGNIFLFWLLENKVDFSRCQKVSPTAFL